MDRPLDQSVPRHRKIFVNGFEQTTDVLLREVAGRHEARVFPKVRVADVLEIANSGLTGSEYSYALRAHFDFLVGDEDGTPRFAVEFDGPQHLTNPATRHRDRINDHRG